MAFLAFIPFFLLPQMVNWAAGQASLTAITLTALLSHRVYKKKWWTFKLIHLPWIIWPLYLFLRSNPEIEYFSENSLILMSMLMSSLLIYTSEKNKERFTLLIFVAIFLLPCIQIIGYINGNSFFSQNSVFAQENVYQFVNLISIGYLFWQAKFQINSKFHKISIILLISLLCASMLMGDAFNRGQWDISAGDSIGIWLGLICGLLAVLGIWLAVKCRFPSQILVLLGGVIAILWAILPLVLPQIPVWNSQQNSSITSRIVFWQATYDLIQNHFALGVGYGSYGSWIQNYWPTLDTALIKTTALPISAHNHHLQFWAETGLIGLMWSVLLWTVPWLIAIYRYSQTKSKRILFWIGFLASIQSVMVVLEVTQMFVSGQILAWLALTYATKYLFISDYSVQIRSLFFLAIIPIVIALSWDRGWQIYSQYLSAPSELKGFVEKSQLQNLNKAITLHGKNAAALYYVAELHRENKHFSEALKAINIIQDISGTQWPIHRMRAEVYHAMEEEETACIHAQWPLKHSAHKRDQALRNLLQCQ